MSLTHKILEEIEIHAKNGGLVIDPKHASSKNQWIRVETWIGDQKKGYGIGFSDSDDVAFDDTLAIQREIDFVADKSYKEAESNYFELRSKNTKTEGNPFNWHSEEKPVNFSEEIETPAVDLEALCKILTEASDKLFEGIDTEDKNENKGIVNEEVSLALEKETRRYVNSEGTAIKTESYMAHVAFTVLVRDKEGQEKEYIKTICTLNPRELLDQSLINEVIDDLLKTAKDRINCEALDSGTYKVIFDPKALGTAVHEALGAHLVSAQHVLEDHATTFGVNKLEKQVMSADISVYDDATLSGGWGSYKYDEEGVPSQRTVLVENGILKSYLHTRNTAAKLKKILPKKRPALYKDGRIYFDGHSNGKARIGADDGSIGFPEPRTSNLIIESSNLKTRQDLIDQLIYACKKDGDKFGILVEGGSGDVDVETGEFRYYPNRMTKVYIDGTQEPVSRAIMIDKPHTFLGNIKILGGEYGSDKAWCGGSSGIIPSEIRSPWGLVYPVEFKTEEDEVPKPRYVEKLKRKPTSQPKSL